MLFEGKCFKFLYEFFYGVFKVRLNTQQNSPAAHCSAIQNSIVKFNLNSAEIALSKPVSVFSEESGSFRSYSRSVRSFRPGSFRSHFWDESFRPSWGGSFRPYFWGESFLPDLFIMGKQVKYYVDDKS